MSLPTRCTTFLFMRAFPFGNVNQLMQTQTPQPTTKRAWRAEI